MPKPDCPVQITSNQRTKETIEKNKQFYSGHPYLMTTHDRSCQAPDINITWNTLSTAIIIKENTRITVSPFISSRGMSDELFQCKYIQYLPKI